MKKTFMYGFAALATIALTACGGGGSDGGGGGEAPETYVKGAFYDARMTGNTYPDDAAGLGAFGGECIGQHHYFEDDNKRIRVYGSSGISESTFELMATHIDNNLDSVMSLFNTSWASFVSQRQILTLSGMDSLLKYQINADGSVKAPLADQYDGHALTDAAQSYVAWKAMTDAEKQQTLVDVADMLDQSAANGAYITEEEYPENHMQDSSFFVACLNPNMGGNTSGEGTMPGMALTSIPSSYNGDLGRLIKHEIVHFVQSNMTRVGGVRRHLPRWFEEGQAVVFAGQSYHGPSAHYNYEPLNVTSPTYEVGDPGEAYKHYGLAYNYLDKANGKAGMADFLWSIRDISGDPTDASYPMGTHSPRFTRAFDATIVDHNGDPLTFSDYQTNYHDIMNTQY